MATNDLVTGLTATAAASAQEAVGFQVQRLVTMCVEGGLNMILGQSTNDRKKEMDEHFDKLAAIVEKNKVNAVEPRLSPRETAENDIRDTNRHISSAINELRTAREKSKCGVCKTTIDETINYVSEMTGEILETSEKVLAMRKLKDAGEIPEISKWGDLTKKQKKLVETIVDKYHPLTAFEQRRQEDKNVKESGKRTTIRKTKPQTVKKTRKPQVKKGKYDIDQFQGE